MYAVFFECLYLISALLSVSEKKRNFFLVGYLVFFLLLPQHFIDNLYKPTIYRG